MSWATWLLFIGVPALCVVCLCGVLGHLAPVHRCAHSVCCFACAVSWATCLLFIGVPTRCVVLRVRCPCPLGCCSAVCLLGVLCCLCGVLGHLAPVHRCAHSLCCVACAVSWANWLLFTGVPARRVALRVRCPAALSSCSAVCPLGVWCCLCGVLGHLAPVHRCARSVCCFACAVSWATWLLFGGVPARCVPLHVRCLGPLGSCSPVCPLGVLCCLCGVLGHLAPVHRCARSVCCFACAVSWATWLLFGGVPARCVPLHVRCLGPLGSCSPVCPRALLCCVCGVLGHLAPVHRCARSVCCFACAMSWATWLLFTAVPARCVALRVRCRGPLCFGSPLCPLGALLCVCGVLGHFTPVHRCARSVRCFACAMSWATRFLFTGVPARFVVLRVRCPGPLGSCSLVCPLGVLFCLCDVLGHLAPVHRCARSVRCFACAVRGPLDSCLPVCPLGALLCVCGVLGHLTPVHRCARSQCCFACAVSCATWLLFTGVPAQCVALRVRCPAPLGSCSPVCPLNVLFCLCVVLGHLASVHRCTRSVSCLRVRCPGPLGSCSPLCPLGVLFCLCGVLGHLAAVHRCARSVCCVACKASWATWFLFTGVPARCVVLLVACAGRRGGALTRPSGRGLFVAGRGWVPSRRALVHPDGGCS